MQAWAPEAAAKEPAAQLVQLLAPAAEYVPGLQEAQLELIVEAAYSPLTQGAHDALAKAPANFPATHDAQALAPVLAWKVPTAQLEQATAAAAEK